MGAFFPMHPETGLYVLKSKISDHQAYRDGWDHALRAAIGYAVRLIGEGRVSTFDQIQRALITDLSQR